MFIGKLKVTIASTATLNLDLTLDAKGNSNAVFIFQVEGAFSTSASSQIKLINGAMACNVFWKIEGLVDMASGTSMKGTIIANNAAIIMHTGTTLEGRALSTAGAITVDGVLAYTPIGCGSPTLTGPVAPDLASTACYVLFSGNGSVTNTGITTIKGDVGTNVGTTTGYDPLLVSGKIHPIPDLSTAKCATDLLDVYKYLSKLSPDIELLYPVQFGNDLVLTPHTYIMKGAAELTGNLYLNAQGNANAVFVIQINGAISTSTYASVILTNGAQSKNVYWMIEGAVSINNYSVFRGTIICHDGSLGALNTGVTLDGRALTTSGSLTTNSVTSTMAVECPVSGTVSLDAGNKMNAVSFYPNPFSTSVGIMINDVSKINNCQLKIYNILGSEVFNTNLTKQYTSISTSNLPSGIYLYKVNSNNTTIQSGKLISQQ